MRRLSLVLVAALVVGGALPVLSARAGLPLGGLFAQVARRSPEDKQAKRPPATPPQSTPAAAAAKSVDKFLDKNNDGVDDRQQPKVQRPASTAEERTAGTARATGKPSEQVKPGTARKQPTPKKKSDTTTRGPG